MIPQDKFGKDIYPNIFKELKRNEEVLLRSGYKEAKGKPNLFFRKTSHGILFADMRGTKDVPMWSDIRPLFFWNFDKSVEKWIRRRLIKQELLSLAKDGCECRITFNHMAYSDEFPFGCAWGEWELYEWDDGHCRVCGKDFRSDESFCSTECKQTWEDALKETCKVCDKKILLGKVVMHHVKYFPPEIIAVHASCHNKIHKTNLYPNLRPGKDEIEKFYRKQSSDSVQESAESKPQNEAVLSETGLKKYLG